MSHVTTQTSFDGFDTPFCSISFLFISRKEERKKRANSIRRTTKNKKITEKTVSPTYDVDDDHKYTDPPMAHSITAAVTQSVLGELKRAGIHSQHVQNKTHPGCQVNDTDPAKKKQRKMCKEKASTLDRSIICFIC